MTYFPLRAILIALRPLTLNLNPNPEPNPNPYPYLNPKPTPNPTPKVISRPDDQHSLVVMCHRFDLHLKEKRGRDHAAAQNNCTLLLRYALSSGLEINLGVGLIFINEVSIERYVFVEFYFVGFKLI